MADLTFTDANFDQEVIKSTTPVLVDFWAEWCQPCKLVSPIVEEIAGEYEGKLKVGKLNVDENQQISGSFNIMSIPTLLIFKNGEPVKSIVGAQPKQSIIQAISEVL